MALGLDPDRFWDKTPAEIHRITTARDYRLAVEHNDRMAQVWVLARMTRAKKLPALSKLQIKLKTKPRPMQPMAQQIAIAKMWAALGYGRIKTKG